jgi:hypothetical protein
VALAQGGNEQVLRIPAIGVPVEDPVARSFDRRFSFRRDEQLAPVRLVRGCACAAIAEPLHAHGVFVVEVHQHPSLVLVRALKTKLSPS